MSKKIGFWAVFALVTGSQIGSGVFMLPASLAPYGLYSLSGWVMAGLGAVALALVFALLCSRYPKTGGPHVYVKEAFGDQAGFLTGWTYWVISWISTSAVIVASIGYLTPLIGEHSALTHLVLQLALLFLITGLNFKGVQAAGNAEFVLTILKMVPLVAMPLAALFFFNIDNFVVDAAIAEMPTSQLLSHVTLLTLWGFIGLESATTPAGSVENPGKTIPRAVVFGTICVAVLYIFNSVGIMGVIPGEQLAASKAPYADAARFIFGGNWHLVISLIASIVCIGTLNAWMLASGQISLGLAQDGLMPALFGKKNKQDAPYWGLFISCCGIVPLLILTANDNLAQQMNAIIDFSVMAFLFVYAICCIALLKLVIRNEGWRLSWPIVCGVVALTFCIWVIYETSLQTVLVAALFPLSGLPIMLIRKLKARFG